MKIIILIIQILVISILNFSYINNTFSAEKNHRSKNKNISKQKISSNKKLEYFGTANIIDDENSNKPNIANLHQLPGKKSGIASYYADKFHGRKTATGEIFNQNLFTGASNHFPLNTQVVVWRADTGKCIEVKINDRMHEKLAKTRVIDLTKKAAEILGILKKGIRLVHVAKKTKNFPGCSNNKYLLANNENATENAVSADKNISSFTEKNLKSNLENISLVADNLTDNVLYEIDEARFNSLKFSPYMIEDLRGKLEAVEEINMQNNNQ